MMNAKEFAEKHGLPYESMTLTNIRTRKEVTSYYIIGRHIELRSAHYATSIIEVLNSKDEVVALEYRGDKSMLHEPFDPENEREARKAIDAVFGENHGYNLIP